jgi:hypothetical protein
MESVQFGRHGSADPFVRDDEGGGLFSPREETSLTGWACPDCRLFRFYVDD